MWAPFHHLPPEVYLKHDSFPHSMPFLVACIECIYVKLSNILLNNFLIATEVCIDGTYRYHFVTQF